MKKILLITVMTANLSLASLTANASANGLSLCSENYPHQINIFCNGKQSPAIPASKQTKSCANLFGSSVLPWTAIQSVIFNGKSSATCVFKDQQTILGSGLLSINKDSGALTHVVTDPTIKVTITPNDDKFHPQMSILISPAE